MLLNIYAYMISSLKMRPNGVGCGGGGVMFLTCRVCFYILARVCICTYIYEENSCNMQCKLLAHSYTSIARAYIANYSQLQTPPLCYITKLS